MKQMLFLVLETEKYWIGQKDLFCFCHSIKLGTFDFDGIHLKISVLIVLWIHKIDLSKPFFLTHNSKQLKINNHFGRKH